MPPDWVQNWKARSVRRRSRRMAGRRVCHCRPRCRVERVGPGQTQRRVRPGGQRDLTRSPPGAGQRRAWCRPGTARCRQLPPGLRSAGRAAGSAGPCAVAGSNRSRKNTIGVVPSRCSAATPRVPDAIGHQRWAARTNVRSSAAPLTKVNLPWAGAAVTVASDLPGRRGPDHRLRRRARGAGQGHVVRREAAQRRGPGRARRAAARRRPCSAGQGQRGDAPRRPRRPPRPAGSAVRSQRRRPGPPAAPRRPASPGSRSGGALPGGTVAAAARVAARSRSSVLITGLIMGPPPGAAGPARPARGTWWT